MPSRIIYGDASRQFSPSTLRSTLQALNITQIDTAARYQNGESEKALGSAKLAADFTIDTKILVTGHSGDNSLTHSAIISSLENSLRVLGVEKVHTLYAHSPDHITSLLETARAFDEHYRAGHFEKLGVSNFNTSMLQAWLDISEKHGLVKPTVFQGQYNLLCRSYEETRFPLLRKEGISFVAYSPLAHGFLTGAYSIGDKKREMVEGSMLKKWYDYPGMHDAVAKLDQVSVRTGLGMRELALRWLRFHSELGEGDAIIVGGSKLEYVEGSVMSLEAGPLSEDVVKELEGLWESVREQGKKIVL